MQNYEPFKTAQVEDVLLGLYQYDFNTALYKDTTKDEVKNNKKGGSNAKK